MSNFSRSFPSGSFIAPRAYLVLVKDRATAFATYGTNLITFDEFSGSLQTNGETLTLIKPGPTPDLDVAVDKVRYHLQRYLDLGGADGDFKVREWLKTHPK